MVVLLNRVDPSVEQTGTDRVDVSVQQLVSLIIVLQLLMQHNECRPIVYVSGRL